MRPYKVAFKLGKSPVIREETFNAKSADEASRWIRYNHPNAEILGVFRQEPIPKDRRLPREDD